MPCDLTGLKETLALSHQEAATLPKQATCRPGFPDCWAAIEDPCLWVLAQQADGEAGEMSLDGGSLGAISALDLHIVMFHLGSIS